MLHAGLRQPQNLTQDIVFFLLTNEFSFCKILWRLRVNFDKSSLKGKYRKDFFQSRILVMQDQI